MRYSFIASLIAEIGPSLGIRVELEPEYQFAGELIFPNGKRHLFRGANFNINPAGSTAIAKDKGYTGYFLRKHGFCVPQHQAFFSDAMNRNLPPARRRNLDDAVRYAATLGFPVFIKPNDLSQGDFVTKAYQPQQIMDVAPHIFQLTDVLLIEQPCIGRDYRVVVMGDQVIAAYERIPFSVEGDGEQAIAALIVQAKARLAQQDRPFLGIDATDPRIVFKLQHQGFTADSIPALGQRVFLLDNANLSTGGASQDCSAAIHPSFADIAIRASQTLGLRLTGVDIICPDLTQSAASQSWGIIEINAAPGLDNYASMGAPQMGRVKNLYRRILEELAQSAR